MRASNSLYSIELPSIALTTNASNNKAKLRLGAFSILMVEGGRSAGNAPSLLCALDEISVFTFKSNVDEVLPSVLLD